LPLNHILFKIYSKIVKGPSKDTKILFAGMRKELEEQTTRKIFLQITAQKKRLSI